MFGHVLSTDKNLCYVTKWPTETEVPIYYYLFWERDKLEKTRTNKIAVSNWKNSELKGTPPGGLEPPTFRLTAERASRLRHRGMLMIGWAVSPMELKRLSVLSCFWRTSVYLRPSCASLTSVRYGLVVRIPGSHPGGPGSIPGVGNPFLVFCTWHLPDSPFDGCW